MSSSLSGTQVSLTFSRCVCVSVQIQGCRKQNFIGKATSSFVSSHQFTRLKLSACGPVSSGLAWNSVSSASWHKRAASLVPRQQIKDLKTNVPTINLVNITNCLSNYSKPWKDFLGLPFLASLISSVSVHEI